MGGQLTTLDLLYPDRDNQILTLKGRDEYSGMFLSIIYKIYLHEVPHEYDIREGNTF